MNTDSVEEITGETPGFPKAPQNETKGKITKMTGMAKKKTEPSQRKGELMENNTDAMEVCENPIP